MMIWATIAEYYTPQDGTAYLTFLVDDLDIKTTSLQAFLGLLTLHTIPAPITKPQSMLSFAIFGQVLPMVATFLTHLK